MINLRKSDERGKANHGWLNTRFTFSFADYHDSKHMGWGHLRVINDDWVAPNMGFDMHPHRDMEIITYMLEGELEHKDSMGNKGTIYPGEVQVMTAGSGIIHSEFNPSNSQKCHLLQIWLFPRARGLEPTYTQNYYSQESKQDNWVLIASADGRDNSVRIQQDADLFCSKVSSNKSLNHKFIGNYGWVHIVNGKANINGIEVSSGDGLGIESESELVVNAIDDTELLLFDMIVKGNR